MRKEMFCMFLIVMAVFLVFTVHSAYGADELFLRGFVKDIDYGSGLVTVDVTTDGCTGIRTFRVDDVRKLDKDMIEKEIWFPIDSSTCYVGEIHKMILPGGESK